VIWVYGAALSGKGSSCFLYTWVW